MVAGKGDAKHPEGLAVGHLLRRSVWDCVKCHLVRFRRKPLSPSSLWWWWWSRILGDVSRGF